MSAHARQAVVRAGDLDVRVDQARRAHLLHFPRAGRPCRAQLLAPVAQVVRSTLAVAFLVLAGKLGTLAGGGGMGSAMADGALWSFSIRRKKWTQLLTLKRNLYLIETQNSGHRSSKVS